MSSFAELTGKKVLTRIAISDQDSQFMELDATVTTTHSHTATVTKHPVEKGADVADHIKADPDVVQVDGIVSNTPVIAFASLRAEPASPGGNAKTRAEDAYKWLKGLQKQGRTVKLTTNLEDYAQMVLTKLSVTRDKDTSNIVSLSMTFEEILIAVTDNADVPEAVNTSRKPRTNQGKKPKVAEGAGSKLTTRTSLLRGLINSAAGLP